MKRMQQKETKAKQESNTQDTVNSDVYAERGTQLDHDFFINGKKDSPHMYKVFAEIY